MLSTTSPVPDPEVPANRRRRRLARRAAAVLAGLALAAGAAACDSGDDDGGPEPLGTAAYLAQINAAQARFADDAAALDLADPASAKAFGAALGRLEGLIDQLRRRLAQIREPEAVSAEQDELVAQLRDYRDAIAREQGALTSGDARRATAAAREVRRASTAFSREFDATITRINENLGLEPGTSSD